MNKRDNIDSSRLSHYIFIGLIAIALAVLNWFYLDEHTSSNSEVINSYSLRDEDMNKTRVPAVAGLFYPADVYQLSNVVEGYLNQVGPVLTPRPHMLIVPHAGYQYSAAVAASAYKKLLPFKNEIKKIILVGPSHRVALRGAALSTAAQFATPLGVIPTDTEITNELLALPQFSANDRAHAEEHSLEVQLPFLQKVLSRFTIVPIAYGQMEPADLATALQPYLERNDTLIIFSADLSHFLDYDTAKVVDNQTAELVDRQEALESHLSCGATGINAALLLAKKMAFQPKLLDMANSGDVTGERDSVVGYASWSFDKKEEAVVVPQTSLEQEVENLHFFAKHFGTKLMQIAETSLSVAVKNHKHFEPSRDDFDEILFNKGAAFVTLTKEGELRGCIGSLLPKQAIARDIADNTYAAAFDDHRFSPVTEEELPELKISISLLSGYEQINYTDEANLLAQLQPGVDGLVIRDGDRQALFLPSVWVQLPDKSEFLNNLKLKAGFSPSFWNNKIKAYRFRTVEIKENED